MSDFSNKALENSFSLLPHKLPQLILRKVPRTKQTQLSCFLCQHFVVVVALLGSEAGAAGGDCEADCSECLGEFGCGIVSGGSCFEDLSDCIFVVCHECLIAGIVLDVDSLCSDDRISRICAVEDAPAFVNDVDKAGEGRRIFDVAYKEHFRVDGTCLALGILGLFFPSFDNGLTNEIILLENNDIQE